MVGCSLNSKLSALRPLSSFRHLRPYSGFQGCLLGGSGVVIRVPLRVPLKGSIGIL